jgi:hypothetical protein
MLPPQDGETGSTHIVEPFSLPKAPRYKSLQPVTNMTGMAVR